MCGSMLLLVIRRAKRPGIGRARPTSAYASKGIVKGIVKRSLGNEVVEVGHCWGLCGPAPEVTSTHDVLAIQVGVLSHMFRIVYSYNACRALDPFLGVFTGVLAFTLHERNPRTAPPPGETLAELLRWKWTSSKKDDSSIQKLS